jgi:PhzF family phenazine biosynthesis protein
MRLRFFTPSQEMDLCGHATVASLFMLDDRGMVSSDRLLIETRAGILPVTLNRENGRTEIGMQQALYQEENFEGSLSALADAVGLTEQDLDERYPVVYGSTGSWTLLLPVKHLDTFRRMKPDNRRFPEILTQKPKASIHPFCLETIHPEASMHGRHFSSPYSGTVEDPVTGTASGVMGVYYRKHIEKAPEYPGDPITQNTPGGKRREIIVEQGQEMGRDGIIRVCLPEGPSDAVRICGTAVFVKEFEILQSW